MFFRRKKKSQDQSEIQFLVFRSIEAKYRYIRNTYTERPVLLLCFFEKSYNDFKSWLKREGIDFEEGSSMFSQVMICLTDRVQINHKPEMDILLLESHPLAESNSEVARHLFRYGVQKLPTMISMDEPFFTYSIGDRILKLMDRMGVDPDEVIDHIMVTKSIQNMQKKMADQELHRAHINSSQEDWFRENQVKLD